MNPNEACADDVAFGRETPARGWGAVFAMTLCVATLIASEFMPVSLLTPLAADLHMTEGHAGQAIAVSGLFAVLTSLVISSATRGIDRRTVLLVLTVLMIASGLMVAFPATDCMRFRRTTRGRTASSRARYHPPASCRASVVEIIVPKGNGRGGRKKRMPRRAAFRVPLYRAPISASPALFSQTAARGLANRVSGRAYPKL